MPIPLAASILWALYTEVFFSPYGGGIGTIRALLGQFLPSTDRFLRHPYYSVLFSAIKRVISEINLVRSESTFGSKLFERSRVGQLASCKAARIGDAIDLLVPKEE